MIVCPKCSSAKFYVVIHRVVNYLVDQIGVEDVVPGTLVDGKHHKFLTCQDCQWSGEPIDYHEIASGVVRLYPRSKAVKEPDNE